MAPAGSTASDTDAQHNPQCTEYVGQTARREAAAGHTGVAPRTPSLGCSGLPTPMRPSGWAGAVPEG